MIENLKEEDYISTKGTLISFVNHHFGPLRGLNFVIEGGSEKEIKEYLDKQPLDTINKIWKETLISSKALALPIRFGGEMESPPVVVKSIKEGEAEVIRNLEIGNLTGDPFFFRSFIN